MTPLISQVPGDVMQKILSFLLLPDIKYFCSSCKDIKRIIHETATVLFATPSINLVMRCRDPKEGLPGSLPWTSASLVQDRSRRPLISVSENPMTTNNLNALLKDFPNVTSLHLYHLYHMGTEIFLPFQQEIKERMKAGISSRNLVSLGLHGCRVISDEHVLDTQVGKSLREIAVSGTILASYAGFTRHLVTCSDQLTSVTLSGFRSLYDENVQDLIQQLPNVKSLCLSNGTQITCPQINSMTLEYLNLAGCCRFESFKHPFECPNLQWLELSQTIVQDGTINNINRIAPSIQKLELRACQKLNFIWITAERLRQIDFRNCRYITDIYLSCPNLDRLEVGNCTELRCLILYSEAIVNLNLSLLHNLVELDLKTNRLKNLYLGGCASLSKIGGIRSCDKLERVDICGTSLEKEFFDFPPSGKILYQRHAPQSEQF